MISVEEALDKVKSHFFRSQPISIAIENSLGCYLAEDVFSLIDMPPFPQSAMDGYAVNSNHGITYQLVGEIKAGDAQNYNLQVGEAVRIFTGAPVPISANAVIMQEKVVLKNQQLVLEVPPVLQQNIRPQGEQIKAQQLALAKGTRLSPSAISFLVSLGVVRVTVYPQPKIGIVVTGSELIEAGQPLTYGKIYESNSILLANTLKAEGFLTYTIYKVPDNYASTQQLLDQVTRENDFVLVSGGISVGDYDFVGKALRELETTEIFYKVKQKPGKPLFFGKRDRCFVFALPGNPASALTCFFMYALPMLRFFYGNNTPNLERVTKKIAHDFKVKGIRAQFLKAIIINDEVKMLSQQSSAMIAGFIEANAYVFVPEHSELLEEGTLVEVIKLPH